MRYHIAYKSVLKSIIILSLLFVFSYAQSSISINAGYNFYNQSSIGLDDFSKPSIGIEFDLMPLKIGLAYNSKSIHKDGGDENEVYNFTTIYGLIPFFDDWRLTPFIGFEIEKIESDNSSFLDFSDYDMMLIWGDIYGFDIRITENIEIRFSHHIQISPLTGRGQNSRKNKGVQSVLSVDLYKFHND